MIWDFFSFSLYSPPSASTNPCDCVGLSLVQVVVFFFYSWGEEEGGGSHLFRKREIFWIWCSFYFVLIVIF